MRIHVTGNAGAGKTTLAARIGAELELPVYGLDQIVWQPGWVKTDPVRRDELESELATQPDWVIDGVSHLIRRSADVTIFLDVPRHRCLFRAFKRNIPYLFSSRPELPENCPEFRILPTLVKMIWRFPSRVRPVILEDQRDGYRIVSLADPDLFNATDIPAQIEAAKAEREGSE